MGDVGKVLNNTNSLPRSVQCSTSIICNIEPMNSYTLSLEELKLALILAHASAFVYHPAMKDLADELKNKTKIDFIKSFHLPSKKRPDISGLLGTY